MIGVEEHSGKDGGLYLLLFDPSHSAKQMQGLVEDIQSSSSGLRHLRRSLKQMRCKQYQIVYVDGIMEPTEMEQGKILDSLRVPWHSSTSYVAITINATKKTPQRKILTAKTRKLWSFCKRKVRQRLVSVRDRLKIDLKEREYIFIGRLNINPKLTI